VRSTSFRRMKHLLAIVLCCLLVQVGLTAQVRYSGRVVSSEDKTPLALVNVILLARDSSFIAGGVTDELGRYSIVMEEGKAPPLDTSDLCRV